MIMDSIIKTDRQTDRQTDRIILPFFIWFLN